MTRESYEHLPPSIKLRVAMIDSSGLSKFEENEYQKLVGFEFTRSAGRCGDEYISLTSHPIKSVCSILHLLYSEVEVASRTKVLL